jgi:hypothetical protein
VPVWWIPECPSVATDLAPLMLLPWGPCLAVFLPVRVAGRHECQRSASAAVEFGTCALMGVVVTDAAMARKAVVVHHPHCHTEKC